MAFQEHLKSIVSQVDGAVACSIMGFDGIAVETVQRDLAAPQNEDVSSAWVEYANVLSQLRSTADWLKTGEVSEVSVMTEKLLTVVRFLSPEYFLVVGLLPTGNFGKARYILRVVAPKVRAEL